MHSSFSFFRQVPILSFFILTAACGDQTKFSGNVSLGQIQPLSSNQTPENKPAEPVTNFRFDLIAAGGKNIVRQGKHQALTQIFKDGSSTPLTGDASSPWTVHLKIQEVQGAAGTLGEQPLDLEKETNLVQVAASFTHTDGTKGQVIKSLYVDAEAPKVTLLELPTKDAGTRSLFWSASDNFGLLAERIAIYACLNKAQAFLASSFEEISSKPSECAMALSGKNLNELGQQLTLGALSIDGNTYQPAELTHYLFAEDLVGFTAVAAMTPSSKISALLVLDSPLKSVLYTKQKNPEIPLTLSQVDQGTVKQIDKLNALWSHFALNSFRQPKGENEKRDFSVSPTVKLGDTDGIYKIRLQAEEKASEALSNEKSFTVILDRVAPVVSDVTIQVPQGFLDPTAQVSVNWSASDLNGIRTQILEYQKKGTNTWTKIIDLNGTERSQTIPWGNRSKDGFAVRVRAIDLAGNEASSVSRLWAPHIFNAAVMTSSVRCFYCHIRIEGDVAGINFPSGVNYNRKDAGENLQIFGKFYATNTIPKVFKDNMANDSMKVTGGLVENYDNNGVKVFPSTKDKDGVPVFPELTSEFLKERVNGTVTNGDGIRYSRIYPGNLVLTGTVDKPIILNGEFFVEGDLIIKGVYKGIGSLYAHNVFVPDNLNSIECVPGSKICPFPFKGNTDAEKLASAVEAIKAKRSALYLGGIHQTNVGGKMHGPGVGLDVRAETESWIDSASFRSLCTPAAYFKNADGSNFLFPSQYYSPKNTDDPRAQCEVAQVDAFLYGHDQIMYRSYGNFVINGGFVGLKAALIAAAPVRIFRLKSAPAEIPINPRNNESLSTSIIRYDWRLRAGGAGFESLKALFD
jgi:hypothetical protein